MADGIELTELTDIEVIRQDGVANPASGFPILVMKSVVTGGTGSVATEDPGYETPEEGEEGCGCCGNCRSNSMSKAVSSQDATTENEEDNPLADNDATKGTEQEPENTETSAAAEPQTEVEKADLIKAAITEALSPLKDELEAVKADVAKVLDMPIPGGPVQTVPASIRVMRMRDEELAKAARYERMAEEVSEPDIRNHYRRLAEQARTAATA